MNPNHLLSMFSPRQREEMLHHGVPGAPLADEFNRGWLPTINNELDGQPILVLDEHKAIPDEARFRAAAFLADLRRQYAPPLAT